MKAHFITFILLLLLTAGAFPCGAVETPVTYRSRQGVPLYASSRLRRLEQFLKDLFPRSIYPRRSLTIDIADGGKAPEPVPGNRIEVDLHRLEKESLELFSEVGGAMLHAWGRAPENFRLPLFLCGAFRHRERAAGKECRFLGNNRRLRSAEALLRAGTLPDLKRIPDCRPDERDGADGEWFDDHSRLLLELLRKRGFKGKAEELRGAAEKLLAEKLSADEIASMIWGNFNLLPPELAERKLESMLKAPIPLLDRENNPTGEEETVSAAQLPRKLLKHPLRQGVCSKFAAALLREAVQLPVVLRSPLRQLHDSALRLGKSSSFEREFLEALDRLEKVRKLYAARSAWLDRTESETQFPVKMWKRSFLTNARPGEILTPECKRYLERMEEYYTGI